MNILRLNENIEAIYEIEKFLSDEDIDKIFNLVKEKEFIEASVGLSPEKDKNLLTDHEIINPNKGVVKRTRESNIKWILWEKNSDWLFKKIINCINQVNTDNYGFILKFVENFQFAEYKSETKGFYKRHKDCTEKHSLSSFVDIRKLSFSIQLSSPDEYEGGELKFYNGKKSIYTNKEQFDIANKKKGTIIFFASHIPHEVTPVTKGTRYSLVSWVQGPNIL